MRAMFGLVLLVGMALAGFAVYVAQGYINQTETALTQERAFREKVGPMVEVYVVNKPLAYGDALTRDDVQKVYWQESALPENAFLKEEDLFPADLDKPRYVLRPMEKFEPILAVKVTKPGEPAGLTGQLERGKRAFTIKVDASTGVSGFVYPGNFVDVYWTGNDGTGNVTRLIESTVNVIAIDQTAAGDATGAATIAQTVTVQATPEQIGRLQQAQATGSLALSLVGSPDDMASGQIEVDEAALLGIQEEVAAQVVPEQVCTIKTRKGGEVVDIPIPCNTN